MNFKEKLPAISLVISIFALITSISAAVIGYFSFKKDFPEIYMEQMVPSGKAYFSKKENAWLFYHHQDILITNNGGRPVSLIAITKGNSSAFLLPVANNEIKNSLAINYSFHLVDKGFDEIIAEPSLIDGLISISLNKPILMNLFIKPGETHVFRYGFKIYPYENNKKTIDMMLLSLELNFNNGFKKTIKRSIKIPDINTGGFFLMF